MIAPAFKPPAIRLPAPALSRRWLAGEIQNRTAGTFFKRLLKRYSPQAFAKVKGQSWKGYYQALIETLGKEIPLGIFAFDWAEEVESPRELIDSGIPVSMYGIWVESLFEGESLSFTLCAEMSDLWDESFLTLYEGMPDVIPYCIHRAANVPIRLPRGWQWVEPWNAASDMYLYVIANTGNGFLDYSDEMDPMNPRWSIGEINALKREWQLAAPRYEAIIALRNYIDASDHQAARLLTLAHVLNGDWTDEVLNTVATKKERNVKAITSRRIR